MASVAPYLLGDLFGLVETTTHERGDLDAADAREGVEVLDAEGSGSSEGDAHGSLTHRLLLGFKIRWPTAVFDAGTW